MVLTKRKKLVFPFLMMASFLFFTPTQSKACVTVCYETQSMAKVTEYIMEVINQTVSKLPEEYIKLITTLIAYDKTLMQEVILHRKSTLSYLAETAEEDAYGKTLEKELRLTCLNYEAKKEILLGKILQLKETLAKIKTSRNQLISQEMERSFGRIYKIR